MRADVQSAVGASKRELHQNIIEETLRDLFFNGYEAGEEGM